MSGVEPAVVRGVLHAGGTDEPEPGVAGVQGTVRGGTGEDAAGGAVPVLLAGDARDASGICELYAAGEVGGVAFV